jgi:hypothetical protein
MLMDPNLPNSTTPSPLQNVNSKSRSLFLVLGIIIVIALTSAAFLYYQNSKDQVANSSTNTSQTEKFTGIVDEINSNSITLNNDSQGKKTYTVNATTQIQRIASGSASIDTFQPALVADIEVGQLVRIEVSKAISQIVSLTILSADKSKSNLQAPPSHVTGEITALENSSISVKTDTGLKTYELSPEVTAERISSISDLKVNDSVLLKIDLETNKVITIVYFKST